MTSDGFSYNIPKPVEKKIRYTWSCWSKDGFGFGFGTWRNNFGNGEVIYTVAIGPFSIYARFS